MGHAMKRYYLHTLLLLSLLLNAAVIGTVGLNAIRAGHWPYFFGGDTTQTTPPLSDSLDLTAEQHAAWRENAKIFDHNLSNAWNNMSSHREKLIRGILSPQPDWSVINDEQSAIEELQKNMLRSLIAHIQREKKMLSPQQQTELGDRLVKAGSRHLLCGAH